MSDTPPVSDTSSASDSPPASARAGARHEPVAVAVTLVRPLRGEVLRPGRPPEQFAFPGDEAPETLHVAVLADALPVGVASVMREPCPCCPARAAWRVRGMATAPALRGRGIGSALLASCEAHAREHGGELLWCNARTGARTLYERAGMKVVGERFEIPAIGPHFLMCKALQDDGAGAGTC